MRIAIADNQSLKFDHDLKSYWEKNHEVRYEIGANPKLADWADVYYINCYDHNIHALYEWHQKGAFSHKPKIICRALDWEVWIGLARDEGLARWIDEIIAIAPHIKEKLERENPAMKGRVHLIRPGIDTNRFNLNRVFGSYNIILPCNEIDWWMKGVLDGLKLFKLLITRSNKDWKLTIKGRWTGKPEYERLIITDYIEKSGIKDRVSLITEQVDDYNNFLEQFDYFIQPSLKEAFSFVVAECAAKGIKPVLNWWYGADNIWPKEWLYLSHEEAFKMLTSLTEPQTYREYIIKNYNMDRMFNEYDQLL